MNLGLRCRVGRFLVAVLGCGLLLGAAHAAPLELAGVFGDDMVLQRDVPVPVWGWAAPGATVQVRFGGQEQKTVAGADGRWTVQLSPLPAAAEPRELVVQADGEERTLRNVVVGEVWLCSGQSNMAWSLAQSEGLVELRAAATNALIRLFGVPRNPSLFPEVRVEGRWRVCTPDTVGGFSAVAYCFARELADALGVPVGLLSSSVGGTAIEPWTPPEGFRAVPELKALNAQLEAWLPTADEGRGRQLAHLDALEAWIGGARAALARRDMPAAPPVTPGWSANLTSRETALYNGMIHPLVPYALRGAIWYQGESNGGLGLAYRERMLALIRGWRSVWGAGDFPFYFVQLPGFRVSSRDQPAGGGDWALLREAQARTLEEPNTGMACTIDLGDANDIHPRNKLDVGRRLARWALAKTYGRDIVHSGPVFREAVREEGRLRLRFDHAEDGLMAAEKTGLEPPREVPADAIRWFAVAGEDRVWRWAAAVIENDCIVVSSPEVPAPVAVRYAFTANPEGPKLYNRTGLPAVPFRTDAW